MRRTPSDNSTECAVIVISAEFVEGEDESVVEMNFTVGRNQDMEENGINQEFCLIGSYPG